MRVLIVEDDLVLGDMIEQVLDFGGIAALRAVDGDAGVALARAERPDLILMDLMLPVLDGVAAIKQLKADADTRGIPTIAMSAGRNLRLHADELPADGVLGKPFDLDALLALIAVEARAQPHA